MAQAQYDKFIELRKSWVDALTARKQAYWDIPTTPTVTPAPTTPAPVAPQPTVQGVNGETFQVAPVNAQGVTPQAPQSVAPVQPVTPNTPPPTQNVIPTAIPAEIKPTTPETKKVEPIDFNLSQGREWDIQKNVADITSTNPTLLKDRTAYNKAFGYETADQWKKALLDSAFQSGQPQTPNADMMFSSILAKAPVPDDQKTTTQYKIAQNRYLKANSYASMTPSQLSSDITSGKLIEWSQTYEDIKSMNPKLVQDTNNLRIVNGSKVSLYSNDAQGNKVNNVEQSFTEDYLGNFGTFLKTLFTVQTPEQIKAAIYTDDVQQAQDKATSIELELNQIEADQAKMEEITRKELEWTGASAERIRLEVGIRQDKLQNQYNSKLKEYNTYANKANNLITQNTTVYQESMKQQSAQQQALAGAAWQVFSSELAKENAVFEANLWLQTKQAEFEQWLAQQAEMAKDPTTAIGGILSQFQKLGITSDMDVAGHLASFQASGLSLPEYTKQMIEKFKAKPEYQAYKDKQTGTEWQSTSITRYNPSTWANESTPIFYRKKTSGGFEAVDLSGNPIDVSSIGWSGWTSTPWVNATGNIVPVTAWNKTVRLDQSGASGFENAINQLKSAWIDIVVGEWARDQTATIKSMAERYGIPFNASNPAETAQKLRSAGHQVADPWKSNHETWMAIDVYADSKFNPVTPEQEKILNANGWYSAGIPWDAGHFEYRWWWAKTTSYPPDKIKSFETFDGKSFPSDYKTPAQQKVYRDEYNAWRESQASNQIKTGQDIINIRVSDKASEWEKAALQYSSRALNAINDLPQYEDTFAKLPLKEQLFQQYAPDLLKSDNQKILEARKKDFITAILRKESGASIAPSEFANEEKKYFAQPWDSQAVIVAKQNARNFAIKSLLTGAGQDVNGRSINTLYNPAIIETSTNSWESISDRLARLRKK